MQQLAPTNRQNPNFITLLAVIAGFCRRLDIAGVVDPGPPVRDIAYATHGQVIEALIANRLTSPSPLVRVQGRQIRHCESQRSIRAANLPPSHVCTKVTDRVHPPLPSHLGMRRSQKVGSLYSGSCLIR